MKQTALDLDLLTKKTRKQIFLEEMEMFVPWADLEALIGFCRSNGVELRNAALAT